MSPPISTRPERLGSETARRALVNMDNLARRTIVWGDANDLRGKVALVTGGGRGIGAAIGRALAAHGADIAFTYLSRSAEAEAQIDAIERSGRQALSIRADAADAEAPGDCVADPPRRFGRLDILVSNAGIAITGPFSDQTRQDFDRQFAVNVRAPFLVAQAAARIMPDGGRIIMIGSIVAARTPGAQATLYAASKSALVGLTHGLARELGPRAITVNLVQPDPIDTAHNPADGPHAATLHALMALPRHGKAEEVAALVAYLASDAAAFTTGSVINIDGGWSC